MTAALQRRRRHYAVLAWWGVSRWAQRWRRLRSSGPALPHTGTGGDGGPAGVREPRGPQPGAPSAHAVAAEPADRVHRA